MYAGHKERVSKKNCRVRSLSKGKIQSSATAPSILGLVNVFVLGELCKILVSSQTYFATVSTEKLLQVQKNDLLLTSYF